MANQRETAHAKRRRDGKGNRIQHMISQITQLLSKGCSHAKLNFLATSLADTLRMGYTEHELLMSLLDDQDSEFNDIWICDLKCNVTSYLANVSDYLDGNTENEILSSSSQQNALVQNEEEHAGEATKPLADTQKNQYSEVSSDPSLEITDNAPNFRLMTSKCSIIDDVPSQTNEFEMSIIKKCRTLVSPGILHLRNSLSKLGMEHVTFLFSFPPAINSWVDKLNRDTDVAHELATWSKFFAPAFGKCLSKGFLLELLLWFVKFDY
eukprot:TCONS_00060612-protein